MAAALDVYLEVGTKRVFAGAVEWPGWCRAAKTEDAALEALVGYTARYAKALGSASRGLPRPKSVSDLDVVQRVKGDATTEFGAPGQAPKPDERPLDDKELKRQIKLWRACQDAFDAAAAAATGKALAKGPRGGGRELDAIVAHVFDADGSYLRLIGGKFTPAKGESTANAMPAQHEVIVEALTASARGEPPAFPRRVDRYWSARYFVRRSAWHALDHAWEIEDRPAADRTGGRSGSDPDAHLVQVAEQVGRVRIHAVGAGPLELVLPVAARQQPDAQRTGPPRRQQVPHAVPHHHRLGDVHTEALSGRQKQVGVRFRVRHLVAGDHRHVGARRSSISIIGPALSR